MENKFKEYLIKLNKELGFYEFKDGEEESADVILENVHHHNQTPKDSIDRLFALYLIDCQPDALEVDMTEIAKSRENGQALYDSLQTHIKEDFESIKYLSYENYEREGMSDMEAYVNLVDIAQKGRDFTLKDSYGTNDGYFGAS